MRTLPETLEILKAHGVKRAVIQDDRFEIEFWTPVVEEVTEKLPLTTGSQLPIPVQVDISEQACTCGHSLDTEHNDFGCLRGCSIERCNTVDLKDE